MLANPGPVTLTRLATTTAVVGMLAMPGTLPAGHAGGGRPYAGGPFVTFASDLPSSVPGGPGQFLMLVATPQAATSDRVHVWGWACTDDAGRDPECARFTGGGATLVVGDATVRLVVADTPLGRVDVTAKPKPDEPGRRSCLVIDGDDDQSVEIVAVRLDEAPWRGRVGRWPVAEEGACNQVVRLGTVSG